MTCQSLFSEEIRHVFFFFFFFFLLSPENRLKRQYYEISKHIFWENKKKYCHFLPSVELDQRV